MRIDRVAELFDSGFRLQQAFASLELERLGDHGDGERTQLIGEAGDDGRGAGAGAAAKPGRDEHHVRAAQDLENLLGVLERGGPADVGIGAGAQSFGELRAQLHLHPGGVVLQRLLVRVGDDELDVTKPGAHHPVDGIPATPAHANHLDPGAGADDVLFEEDAEFVRSGRGELSRIHDLPPFSEELFEQRAQSPGQPAERTGSDPGGLGLKIAMRVDDDAD